MKNKQLKILYNSVERGASESLRRGRYRILYQVQVRVRVKDGTKEGRKWLRNMIRMVESDTPDSFDTKLLEESKHMEAVCACCASGGWTIRDLLT